MAGTLPEVHSPRWIGSTADAMHILQGWVTLDDAAAFFRVKPAYLSKLLWRTSQSSLYNTFMIPKRSGGSRTICAPNSKLAYLQRRLADLLTAAYTPRSLVHGFVPGKSIVSNASQHVRRPWVLNVDLQDFFGSINFGRVQGRLMKGPFCVPERGATIIAQLCCYDNALPQGACTSPILSNIVATSLDRQLARLAKEYRVVVTRYADDISISTWERRFPSDLAYIDMHTQPRHTVIGHRLQAIVSRSGFSLNEPKSRLQPNSQRQEVTGLVVNRGVGVPQRYIRRLRGAIHAWTIYGEAAAELMFYKHYCTRHRATSKPPPFRDVIRGQLEFVRSVKGTSSQVVHNLLLQFARLTADSPEQFESQYRELIEMRQRDVFVCHASEDKESIALPLVEAFTTNSISVWFDIGEVKFGDSLTQKINQGLRDSRYVLLLLSQASVRKRWQNKELQAALAMEVDSGQTKILPVLIGNDQQVEFIRQQYPILHDKRFERWSDGIENVVEAVRDAIDSARSHE